MASRRNVKYSRLDDGEDDASYKYTDADNIRGKGYDPRFEYMPKSLDKVPWKSVLLALFLLYLGCLVLVLSVFILTDHMGGERSQAYDLFALGIIDFLPGRSRKKLGPLEIRLMCHIASSYIDSAAS